MNVIDLHKVQIKKKKKKKNIINKRVTLTFQINVDYSTEIYTSLCLSHACEWIVNTLLMFKSKAKENDKRGGEGV